MWHDSCVLVILAIAALLVLGGVAAVVLGRGGELARFPADLPALDLPEAGQLTAVDILTMRLPVSLVGYHTRRVDEALQRTALALSERDTRIAVLEQRVTELLADRLQQTRREVYARPAPDEAEPPRPGTGPLRDGNEPLRDGAGPVRSGDPAVPAGDPAVWAGDGAVEAEDEPLQDGAGPGRSGDHAVSAGDHAVRAGDGAVRAEAGSVQAGDGAARAAGSAPDRAGGLAGADGRPEGVAAEARDRPEERR